MMVATTAFKCSYCGGACNVFLAADDGTFICEACEEYKYLKGTLLPDHEIAQESGDLAAIWALVAFFAVFVTLGVLIATEW